MSGYFQRLLARSARPRATIHPLARLPQFGLPQPEMPGDTVESAAAALRPEQVRPQQSRREQTQMFLASEEPSAPEFMSAEPAPWAGASTSAAAAANLTQHAAPSPSQASAWDSVSGFEPPAQRAAPALGFEAAPERETPASYPFTKDTDTNDTTEAFRLMSPQARASSPDSDAPAPAFSFAAPPDVTQARLQAAQLALPGGPRAQPDKTEVHVSIGRIEVTAMPAPAPVKRAAPSRGKTMSLDEYLRQRQQGRT